MDEIIKKANNLLSSYAEPIGDKYAIMGDFTIKISRNKTFILMEDDSYAECSISVTEKGITIEIK